VIFDNLPQAGVDESYSYPNRYESFYPHTKAIAEQQVIAANGPDLATCSLRPHLIFGPRDNHLLPRVIAVAKAGKLPQVGDGSNKVDLTFVRDAARAHLLAAGALEPNSPVAGSAYFISQNEPVNLWDWLIALFRELDIPQPKLRVPLNVARAAGAAMEFVYKTFKIEGEPRLTRFLASELAMDHYYDISRARRDFGYEPQIDMDEATRQTIEYLKTVL
jgi:nucleoside-diphosphate-sugar epimerase